MSAAKKKIYFASVEEASANALTKLMRLHARREWAFLVLSDSSFVNGEIVAVDDDVRGGFIIGDLIRVPILFRDVIDVDKGTKPPKKLERVAQAMRKGR